MRDIRVSDREKYVLLFFLFRLRIQRFYKMIKQLKKLESMNLHGEKILFRFSFDLKDLSRSDY